MLRLRTFGGLSVERDGAPLAAAAASRRRIALLPLLAVAGEQGVSRDKILAYLWPESDAERARNALAQTLHALRRELGEDELFIVGRELRLNAQVISADVGEFEAALRQRGHERAAELYTGPFLDGFYVREAPEFERWVDGQRTRLDREVRRVLASLAARQAWAGDHAGSAQWWRRLAAVNPLDSEAAVGVATALALAGDRTGALQHLRLYENLVRDELGTAPDPKVTALTEQLRQTPPVSAPAPAPRVELVHEAVEGSAEVRAEPSVAQTVGEPPPRRLWRAPIVVGAAGSAALLIGVALSRQSVQERLDENVIAVAPFDVVDREPELTLWREGLVDLLSRNFDGAGSLRSVPPTVVIRRWTGRADLASSTRLARSVGAGLVVFGTVFRSGTDSVRLTATLVNATRMHAIGEVDVRGHQNQMDRLGDSVTVALLRSLALTRPVAATRLVGLGTRSMPALKLFLRGEQFYRRGMWDSAEFYSVRAVELDSTFALALRRAGLARGWATSDFDSLAVAYSSRASAVNRGLSPRDSFLIAAESLHASLLSSAFSLDSGYWDLARRELATLEVAARRYPDDPEIWYQIGEVRWHWGFAVRGSRRLIVEAYERSNALDPDFAPAYPHLMEFALKRGDVAGARRYAARYLRLGAQDPGVQLVAWLLDPARASSAGLRALLDTLSPDALNVARSYLAGWPDSGETALRLARLVAARRAGLPEYLTTDVRNGILASALAFRGRVREAERVLNPVTRFLPATSLFTALALVGAIQADKAASTHERMARDASLLGALAALPWWARKGDTTALEAVARRSDSVLRSSRNPGERGLAGYGTATSRGYLALARGDSSEALRRFEVAERSPRPPFLFLDDLTTARLLAARGRPREALQVLDVEPGHSTLAWVLCVLERAQIAERLGQRAQALADYQHVIDAWRHADPELRAYVSEARAGVVRLRGRLPTTAARQ